MRVGGEVSYLRKDQVGLCSTVRGVGLFLKGNKDWGGLSQTSNVDLVILASTVEVTGRAVGVTRLAISWEISLKYNKIISGQVSRYCVRCH